MRFSAAIPLLLAPCVSAWRVPSNPPSSVDLTIAASEYNAQLLAGKLPVKDVAQQAAISVFKAFPTRNVIVTSLPFEVSTTGPEVVTADLTYKLVAFKIIWFTNGVSVTLKDKGACDNTCWDQFGYRVFESCKRTNNAVDCRS